MSAYAAATEERRPSLGEVAEEAMVYVDMIVVGAAIMPGFLLCVPALVFVLAPIVAIGLVAAAAGLVILLAILPLRLGWRAARRGARLITAAPRAPLSGAGAPSGAR